ncbi:MAG TPA: hypothetical protein ENN73_01685 [Firmicutes bacterium]|nr:hypothetical protein [Bacillota bacterium]
MKLKTLVLIISLLIFAGSAYSAAFNGSSGLVNIPTADVLEHLGYDIGVCSSMAFASEEDYLDPKMRSEQDARFNLGIHIPTNSMLSLNLELGVTQYTLLSEKGRKDGVVNFKLQLFQDPTDQLLNSPAANNRSVAWMPSIAIGAKNIVGDGLKYITPAGPYGEYAQNNSFYFVLTKKFNITQGFALKGHYGWGANAFVGHGKDASPGIFFGASTLFMVGATRNPLEVMLDFNGTQYAVGVSFILNNPQMYGSMTESGIRRFLPGLKVQLGISDFEEAMRNYDTAKYDGKKYTPKIEFSLGLTNDYTIKTMGDQPTPKPKPKPTPVVDKDKEEAERAKALAEAIKAKKLAELAKQKAVLASKGVDVTSLEKVMNEMTPIFANSSLSEAGVVTELDGVSFKPNTDQFEAMAFLKLTKLTTVMTKYPPKKVTLRVSGPNAALNQQRGEALKNYLSTRMGVPLGNIAVECASGPEKVIMVTGY